MIYSTGLDELFCAEGTAVLIDGKPVLTVIKKTLLGERYTESELLVEFEMLTSFEFSSIDKLFEYNNKLFTPFEYYD